MEQKNKDLQPQKEVMTTEQYREQEKNEQKQRNLIQRLYAKYQDTGQIVPNKVFIYNRINILQQLVTLPSTGLQTLNTQRKSSIFLNDEALHQSQSVQSLQNKRGGSQLKNHQSLKILTSPNNESTLQRGNSQMRIKMPLVQQRKHLESTHTPMPTLPFPRVLGKDIISPFPGSQDNQVLKRIIAQHQTQAQVIAEGQTITQKHYLPHLSGSVSNASLRIGLNQSQLSLNSPAQQTLAIMDQHKKKNYRNNSIYNQSNSFLSPIEQQKTDPQQEYGDQLTQGLAQSKSQQILPIENQAKKDNTDIKRYMRKRGMKPSPLEFIKLVQLDPDFQNRFCYCNKTGEFYDFEIVPFNEKNLEEYMTVSSRGIVHFIKGEAIFMSISEWEREQRIYKKIQNISFFQQYRTWKTFSQWKTLMRRTMIFKTSDFLNRELFILDSELSKPLLDIRMKTFNIQKMLMISLQTERPKNLPEIFEAQDRQRKQTSEGLNKIEKEIKATLLESCDNSMKTFKEENRISLNDNQEEDDNEEAEPFLVGDETHKQMPYTQEATTRTHYKKLAKYIRLTDYMIIDSKLKLIQNSISCVLTIVKLDLTSNKRYIVGEKFQTSPLFEIIVDFRDSDIIFHPSRFDIRECIKTSITEGVNIVCRYELFQNQPEVEIYMNAQEQEEHVFDEQNDLMSLAIGNDKLIKDTERISQEIDLVFDEMREFVQSYQYFVDIFNTNSNLNLDEFKEKDQEQLNLMIVQLFKQQEEIDQFDPRQNIKIVKLDAMDMKQRIRKSPMECWHKIKELIPQFQIQKLENLCEQLKVEFQKVDKKPSTVDAFVDYMKDLKELSEKFDKITDRFQEIEQYNIIIENHRIKYPEKNKSKFKEVSNLLTNTRKKMEEGLENGEVQENRFKRVLIDVEIPKVKKDCENLIKQLENSKFKEMDTEIDEAVELLEDIGVHVNILRSRAKELNTFQKYLDLDETPFEEVENVFTNWNANMKLWSGMKEFTGLSKEWVDTKFNEIKVEGVQKIVDLYDKQSQMCGINLKENPVTQIFKDKVEEIKSTMPVVTSLRDPSLEERHKEEIDEIIGIKLDLEADDFTLQSLIDMNVKKDKDKIGEIALKANKESELELTFKKVEKDWKQAEVETKEYKGKFQILDQNEQLFELLEESMVSLQNVLGARFVDHIRVYVEDLYKQLQYYENLLEEWLTVQRTWIYLENIFGDSDFAKNMGNMAGDLKKFDQVNNNWRDLMKAVSQAPLISRTQNRAPKSTKNYLDEFKEYNKILDEVQNSLEQLLETKRSEFGRFYFLSNDELLSILSEASRDAKAVEPHLRKLFENIAKIEFKDDSIIKLMSAENEQVRIKKPLKTSGQPVEKWLQALEALMIDQVKKNIKKCKDSYKEDGDDFKRHEWVQEDHIAQAICTVSSIVWCSLTEAMFNDEEEVSESLDWWYQENVNQLTELTKIVSNPDLDSRKRRAVVALITQDVHYRDIVEELIQEDVSSIHEFKWQQQLRYYYLQTEDLINIKQVNASLDYGYEYLGAMTRLVITPLTDRCWMTITGALHIKLGAAPAGPAGTGKTESTKDLAKGLGKFCVVFNCSDQIVYKMMEQLFSGLASTGSWSCLDEFNRIDIEVLSVIAQQVLTIRNAMLANATEFTLGDRKIGHFIQSMGIFITMNPGYKGRTELPDNLKVLFRPMSMMIPDYALIAEIMLFAEGFSQAKSLSKKMTKLYKLASEQLSQQSHYDFGMRAVKSVLVMAGQLKRSYPKMQEDIVLIRAMRDSNVPKFLKDDLPLFYAIIKDLFPGTETPQVQYDLLINAIQERLEKNKLIPNEKQTQKIIQFYETMNVRFGVMILGQNLTGKSTIIKYLKKALNLIRKQGYKGEDYMGVKKKTLNPKSISMDELYGILSHVTQEWSDGLASIIIRDFVQQTYPEMKWTIFDGPVDSIWIENMNTVLDDNMTLCLSNGERIRLKPEMRMIFQIDDLSQASPATVSRCGMVYASEETLSWRPLVESWIKQLPDNIILPKISEDKENEKDKIAAKVKEQLSWMFDTHIDNTIELMQVKQFKEPIPTVQNSYIISMCKLFQTIIQNVLDLSQYEGDRHKKALNKVFIYCLAWSFGGGIDSQHYSSFEVYLGTAFNISDLPKTSIFDNQFQQGEVLDYIPWTSDIPKFQYSKEKSFFELVVPTKDTIRFSWLLKNQILNNNPVFFTGITGVGKSIIISSTLQELKKSLNYETISLSFSSQTSSKETQHLIEDKLEKRRRQLLGGPAGKKVVLFIDDVNMPAYDNYGTQMPIELLRQYVDYKGLYDRDQLFWKNIIDTTLICAAAPPEGGRKVLTKRFTRHFHMISLPPTQEESLQMIFNSILGGFLMDFKKEVQTISKQMVDCSLLVFQKITKELRPTPAKSHYTFNLRDISKVFQGICMAKTQTLNRTEKMTKLWVHETARVFHDRLINSEDKLWFTSLLSELIKNVFRMEWTHADLFEEKPLIFGDFMKRGVPAEERQYDEVKDIKTMSQVILDYQEEYNLNNPNFKFDLVLFPECLMHISRICRILRQPRGNALLVGVGGSGKQTLTRLSAYIAQCEQFATLEVKKNLDQNTFRENLKKPMIPCGIENLRSVFLINDNQITNESFLEDINNLLNSGEVPNMFNQEDKESIIRDTRDIAKEKAIYDNQGIYTFYQNRMRDSFHIVLCLSPVGESLRKRMRMFPSLVNCCAINWVNSWPEEALLSVSHRFIKNMESIKDPQLQYKLSQMCVFVHLSVDEEINHFYESLKRRVYITPKSYLDLIRSYQLFLNEKNSELSSRRNTLFTGLSKLEDTNQEVTKLSEDLTKLQPNLEQAVIEADQLAKKLDKDKIEANKKKIVVEEEKKIVDKKEEQVRTEYNKAMNDLNAVLPILQEAENALKTLNNGDISEIKKTVQPTKAVDAVLKAIYMLIEKTHNPKKIQWKDSQQLMSVDFLGKLKSFKRDEVPERIVKALDKFIEQTPEIALENVRGSNLACYSLAKWVYAILNYSKVAKEVEPKRKIVELSQAELAKAQGELNAKTEKLREEMKKVEDLEKAFIEVKDKKEKTESEIELCRQKLVRAEKLTGGLKNEHERWKVSVAILDERIKQLIGDVFVASAGIAYYGPFTGVFREKLVEKWVEKCKEIEVPVSEKFDMAQVMGDPMEIQKWNMNSLPSDEVSISNAILVKYGLRKPLMIDPQQQATKWIKTMFSEENQVSKKDMQTLKTTRMEAGKEMLRTMELCIKNGYQLLMEDMLEQTDPALEPVLLNQVTKSAQGRQQMQFGESLIDYDPRFMLYMTTKMPNPHYLPEVFIRVTVINFTVTQEGLEQQLLAEIVKLENPSIETKKLELTKNIVRDQKKIKSIEDEILNQLVNSGANILEEDDLINYLDHSKKVSTEISLSMEQNEIAQVEIEQARNIYKQVAERGSILYFVIADLAGIDPMYQYSLAYFLRLVKTIITESEQKTQIEERIEVLMTEITKIVYNNICRGLFNSHKLIFSFMIACKILLKRGDITVPEWNLFLKGVIMDGDIKNLKNPNTNLYTEKQWKFILNLEITDPIFDGLPKEIISDASIWEQWVKDKEPQNKLLPGEWDEKLSKFQKMLIFKALREEKLVFKIKHFVQQELGNEFAHPLPALMEEVFKDSDAKTPIIFVLSQGAEPTALFQRFANKIKSDPSEYIIISLGQGQDGPAKHAIEASLKNGHWVLLQNCHLYKSFMPKLEKIVIDIAEGNSNSNVNPDFRLFLTSMPAPYFPVPILQNGIKITNEAPKGIKSNIIGNIGQLGTEKFRDFKRQKEFGTLMYSVCFFHAVIQERRKFGPLGWNIRYEFNESDLETALTVMQGMLDEDTEEIVWPALQFVTGQIVYGGRVTDDIDRRTIMMILTTFIQEEVLEPGYSYSQSGVYTPIMNDGILNQKDLMDKAMSLPDIDNPEIFGLNDNADIAFQMQESQSIVDIVLSVQPRTGGTGQGGKNTDQIIEELAIKILSEIPEDLTREGAAKELFAHSKDGLLPSLTTFLLQEMERFNSLLQVMRTSLDNIQKAIKGLTVMGEDLEMMYGSMLNNKVPEIWAQIAYPSLKPLSSWVENLKERVLFLQNWLLKGKVQSYWLPAFFFPQGFMTALLQNYARKYQIAIDALNFKFQIQPFTNPSEVTAQAGDGVFFYGLYLESGLIDPKTLYLEDAIQGQKMSIVPMILFKPEKDHKVKDRDYLCPVYKTSERAGTLSTTGHSTNFVIMVEIPSKKPPKHWVLRGTAMFCQLDD